MIPKVKTFINTGGLVGDYTFNPISWNEIWNGASHPDNRSDLFFPHYCIKKWRIQMAVSGQRDAQGATPALPFTDSWDETLDDGFIKSSDGIPTAGYTDEYKKYPFLQGCLNYTPPSTTEAGKTGVTHSFRVMPIISNVHTLRRQLSLWWPNIEIGKSWSFSDGHGGFSISTGSSTLPYAGEGTFLNKVLKFKIGGGAGWPLTISSASLVVSAAEYWGFDPGDGGGPILNSTTGALLRSPFP